MTKSKRHHFLPQFLLRGFARLEKGQYYVHRFPRVGKPHLVNIINVGVVGKFHEGSDGDIEGQLSRRENIYKTALDNLRCHKTSTTDTELITEFVFNMMMRTKSLRDGMTEFGNRALDLFKPPKVERAMRKYVFQDLLKKSEIQASMRSVPRARRERALSALAMRLGIDVGKIYQEMWRQIDSKVKVPELIQKTQLKFLADGALPEQRKQSFLRYEWYIDNQPIGTYVLGDIGPIARVPETTELTLPYGFGTPTFVGLPISSGELLVGASGESRERVDPGQINLASVELSRDFFVANRNTQREVDYLERIAVRAELVKETDLLKALDEVIEELEK